MKIMQSVILAAGRGTRLHPLTINRSKAMMPVVGKPIVERVMDTIAANGIDEFILVISPNDRDIRNYFENESVYRGHTILVEQPQSKGTADASRQAAPFIREDFILSACDNLVSSDDIGKMIDLWNSIPKPDGVLSLLQMPKEKLERSGMVILDGDRITRIIEKPRTKDAPSDIASLPLYIFSKKILVYLPKVKPSPRGEYELQDAIEMMIEENGLVRSVHAAERVTLTDVEDLLAINIRYLNRGEKGSSNSQQDSAWKEPYFVEQGAVIGRDCIVGPNVFIERGSQIEDGVELEDVVVLRGAVIEAGDRVRAKVVGERLYFLR